MEFLVSFFIKPKFIYFEKTTKFCKISTLLLNGTTLEIVMNTTYVGQKLRRDFTKFCGLLRIYEHYREIAPRSDLAPFLEIRPSEIKLPLEYLEMY